MLVSLQEKKYKTVSDLARRLPQFEQNRCSWYLDHFSALVRGYFRSDCSPVPEKAVLQHSSRSATTRSVTQFACLYVGSLVSIPTGCFLS